MSDEKKQILAALLNAQKEIKQPPKDSKNPHYQSRYADIAAVLDAVRGPLINHGLIMMLDLKTAALASKGGGSETSAATPEDFRPMLGMTLYHTSGESLDFGPLEIPAKDRDDPQKLRAGVTYMRRTLIETVMGLAAEDDDGNRASEPPPKKAPPKVVPQGQKCGQAQDEPDVGDIAGPKKTGLSVADVESYANAISAAVTLNDLKKIGKGIASSGASPNQTTALRSMYKAREAELKEVAMPQAKFDALMDSAMNAKGEDAVKCIRASLATEKMNGFQREQIEKWLNKAK